jgi:hypothetical protein
LCTKIRKTNKWTTRFFFTKQVDYRWMNR